MTPSAPPLAAFQPSFERSKRILILSPSRLRRRLLRMMLEQAGPCSCEAVTTAAAVLRQFRTGSYDLVVIDADEAKMPPDQPLVQRLAAQPGGGSLRTLVCTLAERPGAWHFVDESEQSACLGKPFTSMQLADVLDALMPA